MRTRLESMVTGCARRGKMQFREIWKKNNQLRKKLNRPQLPKEEALKKPLATFQCMFCLGPKTPRQVSTRWNKGNPQRKWKVIIWNWICPDCEKEARKLFRELTR